MSDPSARHPQIDWASAEVHGGAVTVELSGKVDKAWRERFAAVLRLLGPSSGGWDEVELVKRTISVPRLEPQAEGDLRHFLESVVVQVNSELAQDEKGGGEPAPPAADRGAILDAEMTATLRSFAEPQP
jgi:hypothetical protein